MFSIVLTGVRYLDIILMRMVSEWIFGHVTGNSSLYLILKWLQLWGRKKKASNGVLSFHVSFYPG